MVLALMYQKRLLRLADFLEELPPERFDVRSWVGKNWGGKLDLSCGTTACMLGWATTIPMFRRLGLQLKRVGLGNVVYVATPTTTSSIGAACEIFGLDVCDAVHLFHPGNPTDGGLPSNATPKRGAAHIRRFVEERSIAG